VNSLSNREGIPSFTIEVINDGEDRPRHHSIPLKVRGIKGAMTVTPPPAEVLRRAGRRERGNLIPHHEIASAD
jgi:hypothetical protein